MNINGYTLKAVKDFMGREGMGFSANLYHNNKRIGEVTDTASGSLEIDIYIDMQHRDQHQKVDSDFIERLYLLHCQEKGFKDMQKKTPDRALLCVTFCEPNKNGEYYCEYQASKTTSEESFTKWYDKNGIGGKIEKIDIFKSLDDFNIQETDQSEDAALQENGITMP